MEINKAEQESKGLISFIENPVQEITLDQLRVTADERTARQDYMNGIAHYQLFDRVAEIVEKGNLNFHVEKIYAADNKNKVLPGVTVLPFAQEKYGMGSLESHILRRVTGKISITNFQDEESNGSLAISFHQQGVQIAFGQNVKICSNMSIFGENLIYSYGQNGMPIDKMFNVVSDWVSNFEEMRAYDTKLMNAMKNILIEPEKALPELIGNLQIEAVNAAYRKSNLIPPLNISQISQFTKNALDKVEELKGGMTSLWQLYNLATELHKPGATDFPNILPANKNFGNFIIRNYNLGI